MLTQKQQQFYESIVDFIQKNGYSPTIRELCKQNRLSSPSTAHAHLKKLEKAGYITKDSKKSRGIFLKDRVSFASVPVIGTVTAGIPILAYENVEGYEPVSNDLCQGNELFILKVQGDSMIEKGIFDKDKLIVKKTSSAKNGDIVVALIDDSATVKTYKYENSLVHLIPANPNYQSIVTKDVTILGVAVGLIREF